MYISYLKKCTEFQEYSIIKMNYFTIVTQIFVSCCLNAFIMEILMAKAPQCANLVTFSQFVFITLYGVFNTKAGLFMPKVPMKQYFVLISLFFATSFANNYVYALHVPSTLHMIIRSASSPASMLVSWYANQKRPKINSIIGSILITIGVVLATYGGATVVEDRKGEFMYWCLGVTILLSTLLTGALTGLKQEILFAKYGKHPEEMLLYTHALPLPLFLGIYPQLYRVAVNISWEIWSIIIMNMISQFYCIHSVHKLATTEPSVTVTFILTLRKFISLMISSIVFKNSLTLLHIFGTVFVVIGTFYYFDCFSKRQRPESLKDK